MKTEYKQISELLRYFYSIINSYTQNKVDGNNENEVRMKRASNIQDKLSEKIQTLMNKKKSLQMSTDSSYKGLYVSVVLSCVMCSSILYYVVNMVCSTLCMSRM